VLFGGAGRGDRPDSAAPKSNPQQEMGTKKQPLAYSPASVEDDKLKNGSAKKKPRRNKNACHAWGFISKTFKTFVLAKSERSEVIE